MQALPQELVAGIYSNATMHTPEDVTADAMKYANEVSADCAVSWNDPQICVDCYAVAETV